MSALAENREKFKRLLRELFQSDRADLDFGIYRLMRQKRKRMEALIGGVDKIVANALAEVDGDTREVRIDELEKACEDVLKHLGANALDADGKLNPKFSKIAAGARYLKAQRRARGIVSMERREVDVLNCLLNFFGRYYEDGDFVSKRRYSSEEKYAVPYNGEEVHLHWANRDQYYIKTGEAFSHYRFVAGRTAARFEVEEAADGVARENTKGAKRFYFPQSPRVEGGETVFPLHYRIPTTAEEDQFGKTNGVQAKIVAAFVARFAASSGIDKDAKNALLQIEESPENGDGEAGEDRGLSTCLAKHLLRHARRNTMDYFVHKDLSGFLRRELDFYLKSEFLRLADITVGENAAIGWLLRVHAVRAAGGAVIDLLAQIENLQKAAWEKKKFVTATEFIARAGLIVGDKLRRAVVACEKQWIEWRDKLAVLGDKTGDLFGKSKSKARKEFLDAHPSLPVDTANFEGESFKDDLLASFGDIDGICDGVMIHGDNFQALNLLAGKYRGRVKCVYADPPYNTNASPILYKNGYKHSSWLSFLEGTLLACPPLLMDSTSALCVAINDYEMTNLCLLLESVFPDRVTQKAIVHHYPGPGSGRENISSTHEYAIFSLPSEEKILRGQEREAGFRSRPFRRSGPGENNTRQFRPNSFFAVVVDPANKKIMRLESPPPVADHNYERGDTPEGWKRIYPVSGEAEQVWSLSYESAVKALKGGLLECSPRMSIIRWVENKERKFMTSMWLDSKFNAAMHGSALLTNLFGKSGVFPYPKSVHTVSVAIDAVAHDDKNALALDFFAGSGTTAHAVINLNREDGGRRKFILVEMGEHFDTVLLPRVKKIVFAPKWRDGKPDPRHSLTQDEIYRAPRLLQYCRLESYDDTLENIVFDDSQSDLLAAQYPDYLLKYMLREETKNAPAFLDIGALEKPFACKMARGDNGKREAVAVDLPETFNYLIGLRVKTRVVAHDGARRYLVFRGEADDAQIAVIWRDSPPPKDIAAREKDAAFVAARGFADGAQIVYVNGDSLIENAVALDEKFKVSIARQ